MVTVTSEMHIGIHFRTINMLRKINVVKNQGHTRYLGHIIVINVLFRLTVQLFDEMNDVQMMM